MGFADAFGWRSPGQVFREWARLTAYENHDRVLNLGPLVGLTQDGYEALEPVQWPVWADGGGTARLFGDGAFQTADGRARMNPVRPLGPAHPVDTVYPLSLNNGRIRDHWHTLTRTGLAPELWRHETEPQVDIHPLDAEAAGISDGALTRVTTAGGEAVVLARVTDRQRQGCLFMPMHWTAAYAQSGRVNPLVAPAVDARSGQPEFKHSPARVRPYRETWRGFFLARDGWSAPKGLNLVWRRIPQAACQLHEFAGRGAEPERESLRKALTRHGAADVLRFEDDTAGSLREAFLDGERLDRMLFITTKGRLPPRDWLAALFAADSLTADDRAALLIGRPPGRALSTAAVVCACRAVRADLIGAAIAAGAADVDAVAESTGAGSACGSCRPQISRMLTEARQPETVHAA
jgi:assimilatory nitrate reductase catalytic subunit